MGMFIILAVINLPQLLFQYGNIEYGRLFFILSDDRSPSKVTDVPSATTTVLIGAVQIIKAK